MFIDPDVFVDMTREGRMGRMVPATRPTNVIGPSPPDMMTATLPAPPM